MKTILRKALAGGVESGESSASEDTVKPTPEQAVQRFKHYERQSRAPNRELAAPLDTTNRAMLVLKVLKAQSFLC
jgi:hypothetical protein